jgi:hypothetical protein
MAHTITSKATRLFIDGEEVPIDACGMLGARPSSARRGSGSMSILMDPPYPQSLVAAWSSEWEDLLARARLVLDEDVASGYAKRVGTETVKMATAALKDASSLAAIGFADHVEASVRCPKCPLKMQLLVNMDPVYTVGGDVVRALDRSTWQTEMRTPPEEWRSAPPLQLFEAAGR